MQISTAMKLGSKLPLVSNRWPPRWLTEIPAWINGVTQFLI
jgi:hypothetical protein